ncbi:MAG: cytochrome c oxidase accessory protein CcoG [Gemmatimonadetes bacterium]|nr:cytochrome c oxidase accessory protein CcoG [Gemmatimonadota bacterium]
MAGKAPERVLSTLNADGSRRWLRPKLSEGAFWHKRRVMAYALMFVFFIIPYLELNGKPLILLDIPRRQFTVFGTTFLPTDTLLFMLLFVSILIGIFLLTALLGRVWCGWGCPQTIYMEFLFRPLERLIESGRSGTLALDAQRGLKPRRLLKWAVYLGLSLFLAHTFLAYFVGIEQLVRWVQLSPFEHPTAFLIMAGTTAAIMFDFAYFREQTCLVACPYGRLQSVLLDRQSLIVGYDVRRGEPRAHLTEGRAATAGDCIDCRACVMTCPTGIDIRDGLQMECIHCTQCADACDEIMDRVGKPRGLVRYTSRDEIEGNPKKFLRPRVVLYPAALTASVGLFLFFLTTQADTDVTLLRGIGAPYTFEADGRVINQVRIRVNNRAGTERQYRIDLARADGAEMIAPENPLAVAAGELKTTSVFVVGPRSLFHNGERAIEFRLSDGADFSATFSYTIVGPVEDDNARGGGD